MTGPRVRASSAKTLYIIFMFYELKSLVGSTTLDSNCSPIEREYQIIWEFLLASVKMKLCFKSCISLEYQVEDVCVNSFTFKILGVW